MSYPKCKSSLSVIKVSLLLPLFARVTEPSGMVHVAACRVHLSIYIYVHVCGLETLGLYIYIYIYIYIYNEQLETITIKLVCLIQQYTHLMLLLLSSAFVCFADAVLAWENVLLVLTFWCPGNPVLISQPPHRVTSGVYRWIILNTQSMWAGLA